MKSDNGLTMAYPRKLVEHAILGLHDPLNMHLVKLFGFEFPTDTRQHFRKEVASWLRKIQRLPFKPNNRTGSFKFYFDLLFDYPFGGNEVPNMRLIIDDVVENYPNCQPLKTPEEIVEWLRQFHTELAERLHSGEAVLDLIPE